MTPPGGALYNFPLPGGGFIPLSFGGLPIGKPTVGSPSGGFTGIADTVVNRKQPINVSGDTTPIEIVGLSLQSDAPVNYQGQTYTVYAGLQTYYPSAFLPDGVPPDPYKPESLGTMTIRDQAPGGKTWDSSFMVKAVAFFVPTTTPISPTSGNNFIRTAIENFATKAQGEGEIYACDNTVYTMITHCAFFTTGPFVATNEPWSPTPIGGQFMGPNLMGGVDNFFLIQLVDHQAPNHNHKVIPSPAPLPILGVSAAFASVRRLKKHSATLKSLNHA